MSLKNILLQERKKLGGNAEKVDFNGTELSDYELKKQKKDLIYTKKKLKLFEAKHLTKAIIIT